MTSPETINRVYQLLKDFKVRCDHGIEINVKNLCRDSHTSTNMILTAIRLGYFEKIGHHKYKCLTAEITSEMAINCIKTFNAAIKTKIKTNSSVNLKIIPNRTKEPNDNYISSYPDNELVSELKKRGFKGKLEKTTILEF